ncbi:MAG: hypothetical protein WBC53_01580, partial [Phycisphaerae bacterium]
MGKALSGAFFEFFHFLVGIGCKLALFNPLLPPMHADVMMRSRAISAADYERMLIIHAGAARKITCGVG